MRLMAEKELSKICDEVSNNSIKEACLQQISLFATASDGDDEDDDADDVDDQLPNKDAKHFTSSSDDEDNDDVDDDFNYIIPNNESIRSRRNKRKTKQTASSAQHKQPSTTVPASDDEDDDDDRLPNKDAKLFTSSSDDDDDEDNDDHDDDDFKYIIPNNESIRSRRNKRKTKQTASSAQHKLPCTDDKNITYLKKRAKLDEIDTLTRLAESEADDFNETIQLMEDILKTHKNILTDDESCFITQAYQWISCIQSRCFSFSRDMNLDEGILFIKRYRAEVENKLQKVCRWMPNVMIKEIFVQHLDEFKKGPKPPKKRVAIPYIMNPSHIKELTIRKKKEMADILAKEKEKKYGFHDHNKCIEEREERDNPSFVHLGDWDPISEGGIDLLYAPGRDSKKAYENFKAEYEQWREKFDIQDA